MVFAGKYICFCERNGLCFADFWLATYAEIQFNPNKHLGIKLQLLSLAHQIKAFLECPLWCWKLWVLQDGKNRLTSLLLCWYHGAVSNYVFWQVLPWQHDRAVEVPWIFFQSINQSIYRDKWSRVSKLMWTELNRTQPHTGSSKENESVMIYL